MTSSSFVGPVYTLVVPVGHGIVAGDKVKFFNNLYSVYGNVTVAGATTIDVDITGYTIVGLYNSGPGEVVKSAEFTLNSGDCFRRVCDMPYIIPFQTNVYRLYSYIETMNASNMFVSDAWDYGRPNRIDPEIKKITRQSTIYYSELFIPETAINGLSTVYDSSFETYEQKNGGIYKLRTKDVGLIMMQEFKISMIPVGRIIYDSLTAGGAVGASENVISPQTSPYVGDIGIGRNPESHAQFEEVDYGIDINRGVVWRLSNDGLTPISDTGTMHNFFTDKCKEYLAISNQSKIFGVYDVKFSEYIIAFGQIGTPQSDPYVAPETLAWNERANQWSTFYSYAPENMCTANTGIISFKAGSLWKHNVNTAYNTFYGVHTSSEFWVICNDNPSNVKVLEAIAEETNSAWSVSEISTPNGQLSSLEDTDFREIEFNQYAPVLRDANTPNVPLPELAIFAGDVMRDRTFLVKFVYKDPDYNKINAVNFQYILSNLNNR